MEDKFISIAILLFILSLISERIANFLKLRIKEGKKFFRAFQFKTKEESTDSEWERFVMKLSIICGILVAIVLKADLIEILSSKSNGDFSRIFSWKEYSFCKLPLNLIHSKSEFQT